MRLSHYRESKALATSSADQYGGDMGMGDFLRNIIEIGFGLLYLMGAVFSFVYTMRHGDEFYGSFAEKAMLGPSRKLIQKVVIPHARLLTGLLIAFQLLVAVSILSRGTLVKPGLVTGAIFCFAVVYVSSIPGAIANLSMAVVQAFLGFTR